MMWIGEPEHKSFMSTATPKEDYSFWEEDEYWAAMKRYNHYKYMLYLRQNKKRYRGE